MKKYKLVIDSSCGYNSQEAKQMGFGLVPLLITIDGKVYKGGQNIVAKDLYKMMNKDTKISTSTPEAQDIVHEFREALKEAENVIFIGMSHKFTSTLNQAQVVVETYPEFKGKVHVHTMCQWSSPWYWLYIKDILRKVDELNDHKKFFDWLDSMNNDLIGYLAPSNIVYFYNGGGITKKQYLLGSLLKVIPILTVADGKIQETVDRARGIDKAIEKMLDLAINTANKFKAEGKEFQFASLYAGDINLTKKVNDRISQVFGVKQEDIIISELSPEQTAHMGPNAFGISFKLKVK